MKWFDVRPNRYTRALQIWLVLVAQAARGQTLTYGDLAKVLGFKGAGSLGQFLDPVMRYCENEGLPPLTAIVVNQDTREPGAGLPGIRNLSTEQGRVFDFPWFRIVPPTPREFMQVHRWNRC